MRPYWGYSRAVAPRGGIRAQSKRGGFGETWWARRWIEAVERFTNSARLSRGRSYARQGHVLSIDVAAGRVKAEVQGSRRTPYKVVIKVAPFSEKAVKQLSEAMSRQAVFAAKLLGGQMPHEIEGVFSGAGLSLFPTLAREIETNCTCPDWDNPCKHIAAVFYLLGEEFDRDPFLLLTLRGLSTEALVGSPSPGEPEEPDAPEPLDAESFWAALPSEQSWFSTPRSSAIAMPMLRRLGPLPFWRGLEPLDQELADEYETAARTASAWLGEPVESEP